MPRYERIFRMISVLLLVITGVNAIGAGYSFISEPSGKGLGISVDFLRASAPFEDYFIPGVILFVVIGLLSVFVAVSALAKHRSYGILISMQGIIILGWILIQLTMVTSFHPLHLIVGLIGLILCGNGYLIQKSRTQFE